MSRYPCQLTVYLIVYIQALNLICFRTGLNGRKFQPRKLVDLLHLPLVSTLFCIFKRPSGPTQLSRGNEIFACCSTISKPSQRNCFVIFVYVLFRRSHCTDDPIKLLTTEEEQYITHLIRQFSQRLSFNITHL